MGSLEQASGSDPWKDRESEIADSIRAGDAEKLEGWLEEGLDPNRRLMRSRMSGGSSPLVLATLSGRQGCVRRLLEAGADPNGQDDGGLMALHFAARFEKGAEELIGLLLGFGADIEGRADSGCAPLHHAAGWASSEAIGFLVREGADLEAMNESGSTPLMMAVASGEKESAACARLLLEAGARIDQRDKTGRDASAIAWQLGTKDCARLLEEAMESERQRKSAKREADQIEGASKIPAAGRKRSKPRL